jgi:hypothetical protein
MTTVLSLGAGVQSSALLLMSDRGEIERADFAVFADTQSEPKDVYAWLDRLEKIVSIPVVRATRGNLIQDALEHESKRFASIPFFVRSPLVTTRVYPGDWVETDDGEQEWMEDEAATPIVSTTGGEQGIARRQCTAEYKLAPIFKAVRERLGYKPKQRVKEKVRMLIGISCDETYRMKPSRLPWIQNVYPLIDLWKSRQWASDYVQAIVGEKPPRSACTVCPYRSDSEWIHLRESDPQAFSEAVSFDYKIRRQSKFNGENFLHRSMKPLGEVEFKTGDKRQVDMFNNECEGMCGV